MKDGGAEAKERIMNTVVKLLQEQKDVNKISIRQIAEEANVNSALINYYYQSKENLLNLAVEACMMDIYRNMFTRRAADDDPAGRLKTMIKDFAAFAFNNYFLAEIAIASDLKTGSLTTTQMILPILSEIFHGEKTERELKVLALQLIVPLQVLYLNAGKYQTYLTMDINDERQRNLLLDTLVENIIGSR
jgi:Transcriptional regulator